MPIIPSSRKGLGLKFEEGVITTFGLETMGIVGNAIPEVHLSHEDAMPVVDGHRVIKNQGATSTCVAQAFTNAIVLKEAREGHTFDLPSELYPYWHSRKEHNDQWFDNGTYLRTMGVALRKFGTPSEVFWKWSEFSGRVNRRPDWTAMRNAHPRRGGKYVRIYETGQDRIHAIQQAILAGHDVAFGTRVARSFQKSTGNPMIGPPSPTEEMAGNHAMLIIGWRTFGGVLYFRVLNSWGSSWRDGGLCWMSAKYIASVYTRDLHVVHGWERIAK